VEYRHPIVRKTASLALLLLLACGRDRDPVEPELARLGSLKPPKSTAAQIAAVRAAKTPELRLYRLREAFVSVETAAFLRAHAAAGKDLPSLEALWKQSAPKTTRDDRARPLLHAALIEAAQNRGRKLYDASLPYGKASGPADGFYYLAEAEANGKFAEWMASQRTSGDGEKPPRAEELRAALQSLEREAYEAYGKDPSRRVIFASAKLKEARELLEQRSLAGATLTLLEANHALHERAVLTDAQSSLSAGFHDAMKGRLVPVAQTAVAPVTVTLIRWPYT
jgi:hypothetical protein